MEQILINQLLESYSTSKPQQNIMKTLKAGALLFFLDSAKPLHYERVQSAFKLAENLNLIYRPRLQVFHTLSMKSMETFVDLYPPQFDIEMCLTNCFISSAGWVKNISCVYDSVYGKIYSYYLNHSKNAYENLILQVNMEMISKELENRVIRYNCNTKKQQEFRKKVKTLFGSKLRVDFVNDDVDDFDVCPSDVDDWLDYDMKILNAAKSKAKRIVPWKLPGCCVLV